MAGGITGTSTTFGLPNFVGPLYGLTPEDTPFLSMAGGLTGGESTDAVIFQWQTYDLRSAAQTTRLEGAAAPTATARVRGNAYNVLQIHQEHVATSYTKQAAVGMFEGTGSTHGYADGITGANPVMDEHNWQVVQMLKQIARDVEWSFIQGTFADPANNSTARGTRGMLSAVSTNSTDKGTASTNATAAFATDIVTKTSHGLLTGDQIVVDSVTPTTSGISVNDVYYVEKIDANTFYLSTSPTGVAAERVDITTADLTDLDYSLCVEPTANIVLDLMQDIWDNGGIQESETRTVFANSGLKRYLSKLFIADKGYQEQSRNVGGVNVQTFETDFGRCNIVLERHLPKDTLLVVSMEEIAPVHLLIPDKGFLFIEELGRTGAFYSHQIYGEIGLKYGNERKHGMLRGLHGYYNPA